MGCSRKLKMTCDLPTSTLSNYKSSQILRKKGIVFTNVGSRLPSILFVDIHSCSRSASGIHELNTLLYPFHLSSTGKHLCLIGYKSLFKCTFLPHYTHLSPTWNLSSVAFQASILAYSALFMCLLFAGLCASVGFSLIDR